MSVPIGQTDLAYRLWRLSELDLEWSDGWADAANRAEHLQAEGERLRAGLAAIADEMQDDAA